MRTLILSAGLLLLLPACTGDTGDGGKRRPQNAPSRDRMIGFLDMVGRVPEAWQNETAASTMRLVQMRVPSEGPEAEGPEADAQFVVFYFGPGQGGAPDANISRWRSQFSTADGGPVDPQVESFEVSGMPVTLVALTGDYARGVGVGPTGEFRSEQTLIAAIVGTPRGNLFVQLHGPVETVSVQRDAYLRFIRSIQSSD